ncbi:hypothetical protein C1646_821281 [Rhizophagus diaphanus]|nr:hypothetical protein C1646_821281 [Rhizophagus diaphanus] [Rhizophagus sp. MUCL 43196]
MSITLFCLVKGSTTANAFPVHIDKGQFVGDLKKAIKAEKAPEFDNFPADKLRLWKVEIGGDHLDDPLKNLTLNDNNELSAINEIAGITRAYFVAREIAQQVCPCIRRCCKSETDEELQVDRKYRTRDPRWPQRTHTWSAQDTSARE